MTVSGMLSTISSAELTEWQAYFKVKSVRDKQRKDSQGNLKRLKAKRRR